jgi:hypothetical protein
MTTNTDKPFEKRPGQGSAFKNKEKKEDWHADYKGRLVLPDGVEYYIDVQPGKTAAGEWWFKLKVGKPTGVNVNAAPAAAPVPMLGSNDDDIPF